MQGSKSDSGMKTVNKTNTWLLKEFMEYMIADNSRQLVLKFNDLIIFDTFIQQLTFSLIPMILE